MTRILLIFVLFVFALSGKLSAQDRINSGPFTDRVREVIFSLNGYISDMVSECTYRDLAACNQHRNRCKEAALTLFVGRGDSYEISGVRKNPVQMTVASVSPNGAKSIKTSPVKVYFQRLIGLVAGPNPRYTKVTITSSELCELHVSSLQQIDDNRYECTATFGQWFYGERGEVVVYKDYTEKTVRCFVKIEDADTGQEKVVILLGDTNCSESHRL